MTVRVTIVSLKNLQNNFISKLQNHINTKGYTENLGQTEIKKFYDVVAKCDDIDYQTKVKMINVFVKQIENL